MKILLLVVIITLCSASAIPIANSNERSEQMPSEWFEFCTLGDNVTVFSISCHLTLEDYLDLDHFRNWSLTLDDRSLVSLNIVCEDGAKVCLPWPYRAPNLDTLKVYGCTNMCYFSEYNKTDLNTIPDTLRVLETDGVVIAINVLEYMQYDTNSLSQDIECGPLNLEVYAKRNSKEYFFAPGIPAEFSDTETTNNFVGGVRSANDPKHECRYGKMRVFDISQNKDTSVTAHYVTFINSRFPELRTLNFSRTGMATFPSILEAWRQRFENLETLDLSHNNISRFDLRDMSLLSQDVGFIDLRHNNIRTVSAAELKSFRSLKRAVIDIRDNPFECNCAMGNFSEFLRKYNSPQSASIHTKYEYLWDIECMSPAVFTGKKIVELSSQDLCSTDVSAYIAHIVVLCVVICVLLIVIILLARYRKEVRILAFTRFQIVLPCQPAEESGTKTYDAFVSYSHLDYKWVVKTLMPRLEQGESTNGVGANFRLCLHQRDFAVGAAIADNIVESVEASRHTVLVLSRNFLKSEWCLMEFRTAFHQSLIEKKKHLILVLLEDIPKEELDSDLRRCMQTWTYLHISDKLFWDRLVYSLTDKNNIKKKRAVKHESNSSNVPSLQSNNVLFSVPEESKEQSETYSSYGTSVQSNNVLFSVPDTGTYSSNGTSVQSNSVLFSVPDENKDQTDMFSKANTGFFHLE